MLLVVFPRIGLAADSELPVAVIMLIWKQPSAWGQATHELQVNP
jgi:hypothetical protein